MWNRKCYFPVVIQSIASEPIYCQNSDRVDLILDGFSSGIFLIFGILELNESSLQ